MRHVSARGMRRRAGRAGTALVELAIVIFLFLLLLMGIVEFGRMFMAGVAIAEATREGARFAATLTGLAPQDNRVIGYIQDRLLVAGIRNANIVNTSPTPGFGAVNMVEVQVRWDYAPIIAGGLIPILNRFPIESHSRFRYES